MTPTDRIRVVPRALVTAGLSAARLPLAAAERAASQRGNEAWPPAMAFEGLEATVETVLGSLLRDDSLVTRGRLRQAKLAQLRKATELETLAEQERAEADAQFAAREEQAERQRERAAQQAAERERQAEQQAANRKRAAETKAAQKAAAVRKTKIEQDKALTDAERRARLEALSRESDALAAQQEALEAKETVEVIDESIEGTRAARTSS
ncbi:MAG: hypothetical protein JO222_01070 [Frankiales bacterium]|nr:hypothetical protein [Frankiales bacterium]